jgi:site-specific recombinase XerD
MSSNIVDLFPKKETLEIPAKKFSVEKDTNFGGNKLLDKYENYLVGSGKAKGTVETRLYAMKNLEAVVGDLLKVTSSDLDNYMALKMANASPEYRKSIRASFQSFYRWATTRDLIAKDPAYDMPVVKVPRPMPRPVDEESFEFAYYMSEDEDRAMILLGGMGGLRLSEITTLHMDNREGNQLRVKGKGGVTRIVPLNATLAAALDGIENKGRYGYYFANPYTSHDHRSISYVAHRIKKFLPDKYSAHSLRHRAASIAYGVTKDIRSVQEFLGHANVNTTQIYTAVTSEALKAVGDATDLKQTFPQLQAVS